MKRRSRKPPIEKTRRLVISLDRGTIMFLLSLLSALGITGAGTLFAKGAADEAKVGSDMQVQDAWTAARDNLVKLAVATKTLAEKIDQLQRDDETLKQAINQIQQRQGMKPMFQTKGEAEPTPRIEIDDLPQTIQFPQMDRVQAKIKEGNKS